jgi:hypothetical protein
MNGWTGKGIILAILATRLPFDETWFVAAAIASAFGTMGIVVQTGLIRDPLMSRHLKEKGEDEAVQDPRG